MDEQTLIFYEPVTWGYFSPMQNNKLLDMLLVNAMDSSSIFAIKDILTKICGPMEPNITEKMPLLRFEKAHMETIFCVNNERKRTRILFGDIHLLIR